MPGGWRFPIFRGFDRHWKVAPMPTPLDTVLLPGFDGTGRLSRYFADALPPQLTPSVIAYPPDAPESYSDLEARVRSLLPSDRAFAIVAESFSGPIAIRIAAKRPKGLVALVLVGTFVHNPVRFAPTWMKSLVGSYLFHIPPPAWMVRQFVAGSDAPGELMSEALAAWCQVKPGVLAMRLREVIAVDAADDFLAVTLPMLYVKGTQDCLLAPSTVGTLQRLRPDLEVAVIAAPHFVLQRCPIEAADLIANFLARCVAVDGDQADDRHPGTASGVHGGNLAKKQVS
jgi:pimeloyl-[acyl-carrier protein] methyl ester esterase